MSLDYYGQGASTYRNTRLVYTGTVSGDSARDKTPASGFDTAFGSDTVLVPARRVIIRNQSSANPVTVVLRTLQRGATAVAEADAGGPITIPAGEGVDTYGTLRDIVDVLVDAVDTDVIEIYQQPMQTSE